MERIKYCTEIVENWGIYESKIEISLQFVFLFYNTKNTEFCFNTDKCDTLYNWHLII